MFGRVGVDRNITGVWLKLITRLDVLTWVCWHLYQCNSCDTEAQVAC